MNLETSANHTHRNWQEIAQRELAQAQTRLFIDVDYQDAVDGIESIVSHTQSKSAWISLSV